jgi:hypothetical protein
MELTECQLRLMERLVRAQGKRMAREDGAAQRRVAA